MLARVIAAVILAFGAAFFIGRGDDAPAKRQARAAPIAFEPRDPAAVPVRPLSVLALPALHITKPAPRRASPRPLPVPAPAPPQAPTPDVAPAVPIAPAPPPSGAPAPSKPAPPPVKPPPVEPPPEPQ